MKIDKLEVGYLDTNCYILSIENKCLIVDPGDESDKILKFVENFEVQGVIVTHHHPDHVGALKEVINHTKARVYDYTNLDEHNIIGSFEFNKISTKGHTKDSITLYFPNDKAMFVGDFIFEENIGRCDLPTGDYQTMLESIKNIKTYDDDITIYPGHGNKTNLGHEKQFNLYFQ